MLKASTVPKGNSLIVSLLGEVDDTSDFETIIGPLPPSTADMHVQCKGISRITSAGVKEWIRYFDRVAPRLSKLVFWDCSPPIVHQINAVSNFLNKGSVA